MKKILPIIAAIGLAAFTTNLAAAVYSTSFDSPTFSSGNLTGQDGWVAQTQWQADGAGNISNTGGSFIRGHNTGVTGTDAIGETMTISTSFGLSAFTTPSGDIADFEEGILQLGMSHQVGNAGFAYGLAAGLFYETSGANAGQLQLRANQGVESGGTQLVNLGLATTFTSATTWTMVMELVRTDGTNWAIETVLTGGGTGTNTITYSATSAQVDLNTSTANLGGFQALPSSNGSPGVATPPFGAVTVSDYSIEVVPEPGAYALLAGMLALVSVMIRRRLS